MKKLFFSQLFWVITALGIIAFILVNALFDFQASHTLSGWFVELFGNPLNDAEKTDMLFRKIAHVGEYALLGAGVVTLFWLGKKKKPSLSIWCVLFFLLAMGVLDEFFQSFSNRTSSVSDVILDFAGAMLGIGVVVVFRECQRRVRQKRNGTQRHNSKLED